MKKHILIGASILMMVIIMACGNGKELVEDEIMIGNFELNDTIKLQENAIVICESDPNLFVKFDSLINDSRCPENADCIWSGDAEIALGITYKKELESIRLHTNLKMETSAEIYGFKIQLLDLTPYPGNVAHANDSVIASLFVSKL